MLQYEKQFINLSEPIESSSSTFQSVDGESDGITVEELNIQDSEISLDIDEESNNILTAEHWESKLYEWEQMLIEGRYHALKKKKH